MDNSSIDKIEEEYKMHSSDTEREASKLSQRLILVKIERETVDKVEHMRTTEKERKRPRVNKADLRKR